MSVRQQTPYSVSTGNGFTAVFPFPFKILAAGDLAVYVAGFLKTLNRDYTVSGIGADAGGNVTFTVAPIGGACVSIIRSMRRERLADHPSHGDFRASTVNPDLDRAILLLQDMHAQLGRAIRTPADEIATIPTLPPKESRSGRYMAWDVNGQPVASVGTGNDTALRTDLAAKNGDTLVGAKYAQLSAVALNLHDYIEDDGAYNVMGFVPRVNKSAVRDHTSAADLTAALQILRQRCRAGRMQLRTTSAACSSRLAGTRTPHRSTSRAARRSSGLAATRN